VRWAPARDAEAVEDPLLSGLVRRVRRLADMSQRELARASDVAPAAIGRAEARGELRVSQLIRLAAVARLRLALLDADGNEVAPMTATGVRDTAGRLFPAHLDTRHGDEDWWGGPHRPSLRQPRYTFDKDRGWRDSRRRDAGIPGDHHTPRPGDALPDRAAARREAAVRTRAAEHRRRFLAGELPPPAPEQPCTCSPDCEYDDERNPDLIHTGECTCRCDLC
jgi:transcriptional regulator with XRE-family HTH domain